MKLHIELSCIIVEYREKINCFAAFLNNAKLLPQEHCHAL